jgi:predicted PurR-regulated permease PerM
LGIVGPIEPHDELIVVARHDPAEVAAAAQPHVPGSVAVAVMKDRRAGGVSVRSVVLVLAVATAWLVELWELWSLRRVITWTVIGGFFAIVLSPLADRLQRWLHLRRGFAVGAVVLLALGVLVGAMSAFVFPVARRAPSIANDLPNLVDQAAQGRGQVGDLMVRLHLVQWVQDHHLQINGWVGNLGSRSLKLVPSAFSGALSVVTILVLTVFFMLHGPTMVSAIDELLPMRVRDRVRLVAADAAHAMSGYMLGNFLISLVAGSAALAALLLLGVPYALVLAAWVAFADLIPLAGATMGAIPAVFFAFLHSTTAGLIALVFFIVYQQFENSVVQVAVMRRTVKVNSLTVILSVLAGVELFGFLGAFLAIPAAGIIQIIVREASAYRSQRRILRA